MKKRVNITLDKEVLVFLDLLVDQRHTNRSQFFTDCILEKMKSGEKFPIIIGQPTPGVIENIG